LPQPPPWSGRKGETLWEACREGASGSCLYKTSLLSGFYFQSPVCARVPISSTTESIRDPNADRREEAGKDWRQMVAQPPASTSGRPQPPVLALCSHLHGSTGILDLLRSWESQGEALASPAEVPAPPIHQFGAASDLLTRPANQPTTCAWRVRPRPEEHASRRLAERSIIQIVTPAQQSKHTADAMAGPPCVSTRATSPDYNEGAAYCQKIMRGDCGTGSMREDGSNYCKDICGSFPEDCDLQIFHDVQTLLEDDFLEGPVADDCGTPHTSPGTSTEAALIALVQGACSQPMTVPGRKARFSTQSRCDVGLRGPHTGSKSAADAHLGAEPSASTRKLRRVRTPLSYCEEEWDEDETHPRGRVANHDQGVGSRAPYLIMPDHGDEAGRLEDSVLDGERCPSERRHTLYRGGGSTRVAKQPATRHAVAATFSSAATTKAMQVRGGQGPRRRRRAIQQAAGMTLIRFQ
jgi:hypothetical protein